MSKKIFSLDANKMDLSTIDRDYTEKGKVTKVTLFANIIKNAIYDTYKKCNKDILKTVNGIEIAFKNEKLDFTKEQYNLLKECFDGYQGWVNNPINAVFVEEADKVINNVKITDSKIALVKKEKK